MRLNKRFTVTLLLALLLGLSSFAASIKIVAPEYAGSSFNFYIVPNFLTDKQEIIGEGTFDKAGNLEIQIDIKTTMPVYSEFGVYKGWFVAAPGQTYELVLPPIDEKKSSNPYFRPKLLHFGIKNSTLEDTNVLIESFTRQYTALLSQNMNQIFYRRSLETAEVVVADLQSKFPVTSDEYFEEFKKYKYASLKYMALIQDPTPIMNEFFINKPILYDLPEYSELFDKLFTKYLQYATQQVNGQKISVMLNSGAFEQLMDWLTTEANFDRSLSEAIVLKGVKPLFYSKRFNTVGLFNILQKISDTSTSLVHKATADKIFNELARTMYGSIAPELNLVDIKGNFVSWENFAGKYVYLCFTRTDNEKFPSHKALLKDIQNNNKQDLAVVIVLEDDEIEQNAALLNCDGFEWTVLRGMTRREIYDAFNVRMLPTYFLVDPQGRMAGSQAPWPDENFELQFANILKATKN
jgi:hypothetical protein